MRRNRLIILLKEPRAGRVKTRLGAEIGMTNAAWWFRHQSKSLWRELGQDPRWETLLSIAPDIAVSSNIWPANLRRMSQGRGDLGARMKRSLVEAPAGPAIIIGGDIPHITTSIIAAAFRELGKNDLVFGPAKDGGFWLVGAKRGARPLPENLFQNVRWSCEHTLKDTLAGLRNERIGYAKTMHDIDTAADLRHL